MPSAPADREAALGLVLVFVLLTYGGWSEVVYVSAELKDAAARIAPVMIRAWRSSPHSICWSMAYLGRSASTA